MSALLRHKKLLIIVAIVIVCAIVAFRFFRAPATPEGLASGNGRLEATETAVSTKVQGKLLQVLFREGDDLKQGEVAAILDEAQLKADVAAAEAAVEQARQTASAAREDVSNYQSQQQLAGVTLRRTRQLISQGFISAAQLDKDISSMRSTSAQLSAAHARVSQANATIAEKQAKLIALKSNLDDLTLRAPVDGRILYRLAEPGEVLSPGARVFSLLDLSDVYMYVYLSSADAGHVAIGSEARILLDALPDSPIPCTVSYVSPRNQFTPKEVETKDEREKFMFRVKLKVDSKWIASHSDIVKPGMPGTGWVKTQADAQWPDNLQVN